MSVHEAYPYLRVRDGAAAIQWYLDVFGGELRLRLNDPEDGRVGHAEIVLAPGVVLMLSDAYPEYGIHAPTGANGSDVHLHVTDADDMIARATQHGATVVQPATDQFYGERSGRFTDPFGHTWHVGHEIERVSPEEMQARWDRMVRGA